MQLKMGGKFHLKLNIGERPIANKYREGKMKRTLKRELNSAWNCWKGNAWNQSCGWEISLWRGGMGEVWTARPLFFISLLAGMHFFFCRSTSVCFAGQNLGEGDSLGCVIALKRYGGADWGFRSMCSRARLIGCYEIVQGTIHVFCSVSFLYSLNSALPCLGCWHNGFNRPVLKHGPRSLTYMQVFGWQTHARNESERRCDPQGAASTDLDIFG